MKDIKKEAGLIKKIAKKFGYDIKHSHALEIMSHYHHNQSWNVVSGMKGTFIHPKFEEEFFKNAIENELFKDRFCLGYSSDGKLRLNNFVEDPNVMFIGDMGSGKTSAAKSALLSWLIGNGHQTEVYIANLVKDLYDYSDFFELAQVNSVKGYEEFESVINYLYQELKGREKAFVDSGCYNIYQYKTQNLSRIILHIEDMHLLNRNISIDEDWNTEGTLAYKLKNILRLGRSVGITVSGCSLSIPEELPRLLTSCFINKCKFRAQKEIDSDDTSKLHLSIPIKKIGRFFHSDIEMQSPYFGDESIKSLLEKYVKKLESKCIVNP